MIEDFFKENLPNPTKTCKSEKRFESRKTSAEIGIYFAMFQ